MLAQISPAIAACGNGADVNEVVKKNAKLNAAGLLARSAIIKQAVDNGSINIVPAYYNLDTGKVDFL